MWTRLRREGSKGSEGSKGCGGRPSEKRGASMKKPYKRPGGRWKSVPLFGGAAPKGVHFLERSEVVRFSLSPGNIHTHRREAAIPSPLNPMNLLNPLNPATQWLHGRYLPLCTVGAGPYGNTVNTVQHCFIAPKKLSIPESFLVSFKNQNILRIPVNP